MSDVEVLSIEHNSTPKNRTLLRIKMALRCLFSKQVCIIYSKNSAEIKCRYVGYKQKTIGYVMTQIGDAIYDSALGLEEIKAMLN